VPRKDGTGPPGGGGPGTRRGVGQGARVEVGWGERALELDPAGIVSALIVEQR